MKHNPESDTNLVGVVEKEEEQNDDSAITTTSCGIGRWRPRCLQCFAHPIAFMMILNTYCLVEGAIVSGLVNVSLSSLETRYKFTSFQTGMIVSTIDLTVLVTVVFISYFGGNSHKPRWLGVGVFIQGLGALLYASPQFITGNYEVGRDANLTLEGCEDEGNFSPDCSEDSSNVYFVFILANILGGIGAAPLFTIGVSYIDDLFHPKRAPIWLGIFFVLSGVGPAAGFGIGGAFLSVYVDPWRDTTLEQSDPGWVGAWWVGFIFCGVICISISILFFMFPEKYANSESIKKERIKVASVQRKKKLNEKDLNIRYQIKDLPKQILELFTRLPFVFVTAAFAFQALVISGLVSFVAKYIETQFGLTASVGGLITGAVAIPSAGFGIMLGALIIFFLKPTTKRLAMLFFILSLVASFFTVAFLLRCPTHDIAGVTVSYPNSTLLNDQTLNATCNSHCNCMSTLFEPVCSDGITYFSPCRAGCDKYFFNGDRNDPRFENCTCSSLASAEEGYCDTGCVMLGPFLVVIVFVLVITTTTQIPYVVITLRSVAEEQRTLALGVQSVIYRIAGTVPGPIIFGALFDASCVYWQEECGDRGNCWVYDNEDLSYRLLGLTVGFRILTVLCAFCTWVLFDVTLCKHGRSEHDKEDLEVSQNPQS